MLSVGVDVIETERIARALERWGDRFLSHVYTPTEVEYCRNHVPELAVRFAAKEAVSKAWARGYVALPGGRWRCCRILGVSHWSGFMGARKDGQGRLDSMSSPSVCLIRAGMPSPLWWRATSFLPSVGRPSKAGR